MDFEGESDGYMMAKGIPTSFLSFYPNLIRIGPVSGINGNEDVFLEDRSDGSGPIGFTHIKPLVAGDIAKLGNNGMRRRLIPS